MIVGAAGRASGARQLPFHSQQSRWRRSVRARIESGWQPASRPSRDALIKADVPGGDSFRPLQRKLDQLRRYLRHLVNPVGGLTK